MRSDRGRTVPIWYWIVGLLIVGWGAIGIHAFYDDVTMRPESVAGLPDWDRRFLLTRPGWFAWLYGAAVWSGFLGGVALLLRRRVAQLLFAVSLITVLGQFGWVFLATDIIDAKGAATTIPFPVVIVLVAAAQLWFARRAAVRGRLR